MIFTQAEANYILTAVDNHIKKVGIAGAQMGLLVVSKLQESLQPELAPTPVPAIQHAADDKDDFTNGADNTNVVPELP